MELHGFLASSVLLVSFGVALTSSDYHRAAAEATKVGLETFDRSDTLEEAPFLTLATAGVPKLWKPFENILSHYMETLSNLAGKIQPVPAAGIHDSIPRVYLKTHGSRKNLGDIINEQLVKQKKAEEASAKNEFDHKKEMKKENEVDEEKQTPVNENEGKKEQIEKGMEQLENPSDDGKSLNDELSALMHQTEEDIAEHGDQEMHEDLAEDGTQEMQQEISPEDGTQEEVSKDSLKTYEQPEEKPSHSLKKEKFDEERSDRWKWQHDNREAIIEKKRNEVEDLLSIYDLPLDVKIAMFRHAAIVDRLMEHGTIRFKRDFRRVREMKKSILDLQDARYMDPDANMRIKRYYWWKDKKYLLTLDSMIRQKRIQALKGNIAKAKTLEARALKVIKIEAMKASDQIHTLKTSINKIFTETRDKYDKRIDQMIKEGKTDGVKEKELLYREGGMTVNLERLRLIKTELMRKHRKVLEHMDRLIPDLYHIRGDLKWALNPTLKRTVQEEKYAAKDISHIYEPRLPHGHHGREYSAKHIKPE